VREGSRGRQPLGSRCAPALACPPGRRSYDTLIVTLRLIATCATGLEEILERELRGLGLSGIERDRGAVSFDGRWTDVLRANWRLRTANRVLVALGSWDARTADALAHGAERLVAGEQAWDGMTTAQLFDPARTFAVRATSSRSRLADTRWVAVKTKDGLVDAQRRRFDRRASVHRDDPDTHLRTRLFGDRATLLLDTSGRSLDHRGYRVETGAAPVREQLAAACVLAADWDGTGPVMDPMCGSGTLLVEAGAYALGLAPGRLRRDWAFERLPGFDPAAWGRVRAEPIPAPGDGVRLRGIDRAPHEVRAARANLDRSGFSDRSVIERGDAFATAPPAGPGLLLINPPYGERLEEDDGQWRRLGDLMKQRYAGWRAVVLAGGPSQGKQIGLRPNRRIPVRNGPLEARILVFDLY